MNEVFLSKASTADYRMISAVGAETTQITRENRKSSRVWRNICTVLFCICVAFASCDKSTNDDNGNDNGNGNGDSNGIVKLVETIIMERNNVKMHFEYDNQNRISKVQGYYHGANLSSMTTLEYNSVGDLVKVVWIYPANPEYNGETYFVRNGNIITESYSSNIYTLNNDGYLIKLEEGYYESIFQYQGGNMIKWTTVEKREDGGKGYHSTIEFAHDNKKSPFYHCKTPIWYLLYSFNLDPEFGIRNNITEMKMDEDGDKYGYKYVYIYDSDGYATKQTSTGYGENSNGNTYVTTFIYK